MSKVSLQRYREFSKSLSYARLSIYHNRLKSAAWRGLQLMSAGWLAVSVLVLAVSAAALMLRFYLPVSSAGILWGILAFGVILMGWAFLPALRHYPSLTAAAEQLDAACNSHNLIATALDIYKSGRFTLFARCAVDQGFAVLEENSKRKPWLRKCEFSGWRTSGRILLAMVLLMVSAKVNTLPRGRVAGEVTAGGRTVERGAWAAVIAGTVKSINAKPAELQNISNWKQNAAGIPELSVSDLRKQDSDGSKVAGSRSTSLSEFAVNAQGSGNSLASASPISKGKIQKNYYKIDNSGMAVIEGQPDDTRLPAYSNASTIPNGTVGMDAMPAVYNDWLQNEFVGEGGRLTGANDNVRGKSGRNNGGVQPYLQDRIESPSNELSISGAESRISGVGPEPIKKSRGTAPLIFGVPVPDFVKGKMGPGVNKVMQGRSRPQADAGQYSKSVDVQVSGIPDTPAENFTIRSDCRRLVREYLIRLHSNNTAAKMTADNSEQE